jgi:EpsI family protein
MSARLFVAAFTVLGIYFGANSLKGGGMPTEMAHPHLQIEEMPKTFGGWTGEDTALNPEMFRAIGAAMAINRNYRDQQGNTISMHSAVFQDSGMRDLPHSPEICYPASGFRIVESRDIYLNSDKQSANPVRLITLERDGQKIYCLFWYQFGDKSFCDTYAHRRVILGLRGQKTWPPLVKVMLQSNSDSPQRAEQLLKNLAESIFAWSKDFH